MDSRWGGNKLGGRPIEPLAQPEEFQHAACAREEYPSRWWDDVVEGETPTKRQQRHDKARKICGVCPIAETCAQYARQRPESAAGIWAGTYYKQPSLWGSGRKE